MEHHRKQAKSLRRAFRAGDPDATRRAELVLGKRARQRFLLSDAQHVGAVENGYRTWAELKHETAFSDELVDTGLEYGPGDPVRVRIVRRGRRIRVSDEGAAVARAGRPPGWRDIAQQIDDELIVNVSRQGEVWLPGDGRLVRRIAEASLALYQELLDLGRGR